jgi:hypothetical protein
MSRERDEISHFPEEVWERYSLRQLPEDQLAPVEEHLLVCPKCRRRLSEVDEYIATVKVAALQIVGTEAPEQRVPGRRLHAVVRRPFQWSLPLSAGVVVTVLFAFIYFGPYRAVAGSQVTLIASRGGAVGAIAEAPAHTSLTLIVDAGDISPASSIRLELVDSHGDMVWKALGARQISVIQKGATQQNQITARIGRPLEAGLYWFRVYEKDRLLNEYGLQVK